MTKKELPNQKDPEEFSLQDDPWADKDGNEETFTSDPKSTHQKISLKDFYSSDDHEEHEIHSINDAGGRIDLIKNFINWHFLKVFLVFSTVVGFAFGAFYFWAYYQNDRETIYAAKHVADIAMALTQARLKNIHPQNQNWSDPEFIRNNLKSVLGSEHSAQIDVDPNGQFLNCPYMLRIYTGNHLSHFLVIAQPNPNLLQWLINKACVVADSNVMKLHKITDVKTLNRLLAESNSLDGTNASEISAFVQSGEQIPLSLLQSKNNREQYLPPKVLRLSYPDAGDLIYNAPRYYPLGQNLIKQAQELAKTPADVHEAALFMHELSSLGQLKNMILYSCNGIRDAIQLQKTMNILAPEEKFLIGYLMHQPGGLIGSSHLLVDDESSEIASQDISQGILFEKSLYSSSHIENSLQERELSGLQEDADAVFAINEPLSNISKADLKDPIYLYLSGIVAFRQKALKPVTLEMIALLNKQMELPQYKFTEKISYLQNKCLLLNAQQQTEIEKHLDHIVETYNYLPCYRLVELIQAAKVYPAFKEYLLKVSQSHPISKSKMEELDNLIEEIKSVTDWTRLKTVIEKLFQLLQLNHVPDEELLISYQGHVRSVTTQKLNDFLLSSNPALPINAFTKENKVILQDILNHSWIVDSYMYNFYLAEFDEHAADLKDEE